MSAPTIGALFAGYGGLEMAVQEVLGATPAWVSEIDPGPSRILAQRFPGVPNLGDVTAVDWRAAALVRVLTGGSPCQDLSHAGKRAGMRAGTRSGLWASMCDAIETIRPSLVVWENVRGALSAEADSAVEPCPICVGDGRGVTLRALGRVLGDLAELGYDAAWTSLRAADVGAPHGRFRVFVLAWPAEDTNRAARRERGFSTPGEAAGRRARSDAGGRGGAPAPVDLTLLPTPAASRAGRQQSASPGSSVRPSLDMVHALLPTPDATHGRTTTRTGPLLAGAVTLLPTPTMTDHKASGGNRVDSVGHGTTLTDATVRQVERFGQYAPAIARWEAVLGRPAPAPTEPTGRGGAHRLAPRFVEWLMGLPDGWVTGAGLTRNEELKALGNGVVPQQATAAIRHLLDVRAAALAGQEVAS